MKQTRSTSNKLVQQVTKLFNKTR